MYVIIFNVYQTSRQNIMSNNLPLYTEYYYYITRVIIFKHFIFI